MGHTKFDSEDEDMAADPAAGPSSSVPPPPPPTSMRRMADAAGGGPVRLPRCCGAARVDFNFNDPCYVFRVQHNPATGSVAASVSNNTVKLYQIAGDQLSLVGELRGHTGTITDLAYDTEGQPHMVLSSSMDGTVRSWDTRTGQQVEGYQMHGQELFSFSMWRHMLVGGTSGEVVFWDRRNRKVLAKLDDTHMDDVTQVRFHSSGQIISGSTDGLIAVHDVAKSFNDDDVFQAALNLTTSVEEVGLYGRQQERLWVRTGTESVHLWEWQLATREDVEGGDVAFADFNEARAAAGQATAASAIANLFPQVDYVVGCHYDVATDQALLVAGHNDGPVAFMPVVEQRGPSGATASAALGCPVMALSGGHTSIVRSVHCFGGGEGGAPFCVTGGEDALVNLWALAEAASAPAELKAAAEVRRGMPGGPERKHAPVLAGKDAKRRPSPY